MEAEASTTNSASEVQETSEEVNEYAVDKVSDRRLKNGKAEFLIKWKGYSM